MNYFTLLCYQKRSEILPFASSLICFCIYYKYIYILLFFTISVVLFLARSKQVWFIEGAGEDFLWATYSMYHWSIREYSANHCIVYTFPLQKTKVLVTFNALQHFQDTAYLTYQLFIGPLIWSDKLMAIFEFFPVLSRCNSNSKPHFGPY